MFILGVCSCFLLFFFFKQKTAYEMRISDWSSDVCSSDLWLMAGYTPVPDGNGGYKYVPDPGTYVEITDLPPPGGQAEPAQRSEEHTSELQSLMRISYAVFCLKKKTK